MNLQNDVSIHEYNYDTSLPINPQTLKPPLSSEIITMSSTRLEEIVNDYEVLLKNVLVENELLVKGNSNMQHVVDKHVDEYKNSLFFIVILRRLY